MVADVLLVLETSSCHEGSCDCDRVFKEHQGHFPAACDMRKLLLELEPYREAYARQQITLAFSLYDLPWLTASNVSVIDPRGRVSLLSFDLPAQCVVPPLLSTTPIDAHLPTWHLGWALL